MKTIEVDIAKNGKYFHRLKSAENGQILQSSETYSSKGKAVQTAKSIEADMVPGRVKLMIWDPRKKRMKNATTIHKKK